MMKKILFIALLGAFFTACESGPKMIEIQTDYGNMEAELYDLTPEHRDNMVKLANEGFYDDLLFHRVIKGFMIQGGDPTSKDAEPTARLGGGGPGYQIPAEIGEVHIKGALSAARTGDAINPEKKSSGSQFYVVQGQKVSDAMLDQMEQQKGIKYTPEQRAAYLERGGTPFLDNDYTVFGMVTKGMDVIDKIADVKTLPGDRPENDVKMKIKVIR